MGAEVDYRCPPPPIAAGQKTSPAREGGGTCRQLLQTKVGKARVDLDREALDTHGPLNPGHDEQQAGVANTGKPVATTGTGKPVTTADAGKPVGAGAGKRMGTSHCHCPNMRVRLTIMNVT